MALMSAFGGNSRERTVNEQYFGVALALPGSSGTVY
jgi:hypothetical protein